MRARRLNKILVLSSVIIAIMFVSNLGMAYFSTMNNIENGRKNETNISNLVTIDETVPIVDGNLESFDGEWDNATLYSNILDSDVNFTIRVKANSTHLFFGISYESSVFVAFNDSNSSQPHSWYAIIFDRNFDEIIGTELSPDDAIVFNYKKEGAVDAFFNGTEPESLILDETNNGEDNTIGAIQTETDYIGEYTVTIEIAKVLNSQDINGEDIALKPSDATPFALIAFYNNTDVFNYTLINKVEWNKLRLEPQHEVYSYVEDLKDFSVITYLSNAVNTEADNFASVGNLLSAYGLDSKVWDHGDFEITTENLADLDLFILTGTQKGLTKDEVSVLKSFVANGGSVLVLANQIKNTSALNDFLRYFGMEIYNSTLYSNNTAINSSLTLTHDALASLEYLQEDTVLSTDDVDRIYYTGSAIRYISDIGESKYLSQEADLYPILSTSGEYFINLGDQGVFNSTEDLTLNDTVVLQSAIELRYGGKLIVSASSDMYNSSCLLKENNRALLLREVQWLLNFQYRINYDNFNVLDPKIEEGEGIRLNISITGDNNTKLENVTVLARVLVLKGLNNEVTLNVSENGIDYNGSIIPDTKASWVDVEILLHKRGYGYNFTELVEISIEKHITTPIELSIVSLIVFLISVGLATVGTIVIKRHKERPDEEN
ncbi:MAG: hypothetical protein ACTSPI_10975 [Candidatus Heimdallarchaeaceae archaeon]